MADVRADGSPLGEPNDILPRASPGMDDMAAHLQEVAPRAHVRRISEPDMDLAAVSEPAPVAESATAEGPGNGSDGGGEVDAILKIASSGDEEDRAATGPSESGPDKKHQGNEKSDEDKSGVEGSTSSGKTTPKAGAAASSPFRPRPFRPNDSKNSSSSARGPPPPPGPPPAASRPPHGMPPPRHPYQYMAGGPYVTDPNAYHPPPSYGPPPFYCK